MLQTSDMTTAMETNATEQSNHQLSSTTATHDEYKTEPTGEVTENKTVWHKRRRQQKNLLFCTHIFRHPRKPKRDIAFVTNLRLAECFKKNRIH
jgi:hypothetical protein